MEPSSLIGRVLHGRHFLELFFETELVVPGITASGTKYKVVAYVCIYSGNFQIRLSSGENDTAMSLGGVGLAVGERRGHFLESQFC